MTTKIPGWWPIRCACLTASAGKRRQSLHLGVTGTGEEAAQRPVYLKGFGERSNPSYGARAGSDALIMGVKDAGKVAMEMAGVKHSDINFLELYDDYIIVVYLQIEDLGFCAKGDLELFRTNRLHVQGPTADSNRRRHDQLRPAIHCRRNLAYSRSGAPVARRRRRQTSA